MCKLMPQDASKYQAPWVSLCSREVEDDEEATPWKEQENWEADQIKKASMAVGAQDRRKGQKAYDLVLPDQIEFITDMVMAGDVVRVCCVHTCALKLPSLQGYLLVIHGRQLTPVCIAGSCHGCRVSALGCMPRRH